MNFPGLVLTALTVVQGLLGESSDTEGYNVILMIHLMDNHHNFQTRKVQKMQRESIVI